MPPEDSRLCERRVSTGVREWNVPSPIASRLVQVASRLVQVEGRECSKSSILCDATSLLRTRTAPGSPKNLRLLTFDQANQTQTRPSETRPVLSPVLVLLLLTLSRDIRRHSIQAIRVCKLQKIGAIDAFLWAIENLRGGGSRPPGSAFPARYTRRRHRHDNSEDDTKITVVSISDTLCSSSSASCVGRRGAKSKGEAATTKSNHRTSQSSF